MRFRDYLTETDTKKSLMVIHNNLKRAVWRVQISSKTFPFSVLGKALKDLVDLYQKTKQAKEALFPDPKKRLKGPAIIQFEKTTFLLKRCEKQIQTVQQKIKERDTYGNIAIELDQLLNYIHGTIEWLD